MHGLVNSAIQKFAVETFGRAVWLSVLRSSGGPPSGFETLLTYPGDLTETLVQSLSEALKRPVADVLEDLGTFLVTCPDLEAVRRLLRFGGHDFKELLHSLAELQERAGIVVPGLDLPKVIVREHIGGQFSLTIIHPIPGTGHVICGIIRALADDYGALVLLDHLGRQGDIETLEVGILDSRYAMGRSFQLVTGAIP